MQAPLWKSTCFWFVNFLQNKEKKKMLLHHETLFVWACMCVQCAQNAHSYSFTLVTFSFTSFFPLFFPIFRKQNNLNNLLRTREMMSTTKTSYLHKKRHFQTNSGKGKFAGNFVEIEYCMWLHVSHATAYRMN